VGKPGGAELGHVQFAQEDSPCGFEFRDYGSIFIRDEVCEYGGPKGSTYAFSIYLVLHRHGNAVHGAQIVASGNGLLCLLSSLKRLITAYGEKSVKFAVQRLNMLQVGFHCLYRGYLPCSYKFASSVAEM
jgi:hypothetical protein